MNFDYIDIDKNSRTPLYEQIKTGILSAIDSGLLKEGDKLPTEQELCNTFHISRIVAKQAYTELLSTGRIERKRSKGTFVKRIDNRGICMYNLLSFEDEMQLLQKTPHTKLLNASVISSSRLQQETELQSGSQCFLLKRLRYADDEIFNVTVNLLPYDRFPKIEHCDFEKNSLYHILEKQYHVKPCKAHRCISAQCADEELASYLNQTAGSPLLVLKSTVYDENDSLIEISYEYMSGNAHRFEYDVVI